MRVYWRLLRRPRRAVILLVVAVAVASLLVVGFSHVTRDVTSVIHRRNSLWRLQERRNAASAAPLRHRGHIRSGRQILPISAGDLPQLSTTPLQQWDQKQRHLLNLSNQPWLQATPDECSPLKVSFESDLELTALVSLPSSGNSWLRYLIEGATGVFTGSVYADLSLVKNGMYGEAVPFDSGTTIVQKTHGFTTLDGINATREQQRSTYSHVNQFNCRALLLIRSPLPAIRSHRHLDIGGHTGFAPSTEFQGPGWDAFVAHKALLWRLLYADWIEQCPPEKLLVVYFENLKQDLEGEMKRILRFLGRKPDPARMDCLLRHRDGRLQRKNRRHEITLENAFTSEQRAQVEEEVRRLDQVLLSHGFRALPEYS